MIQPTNPQVVYVPQYNPTVVYGTPVQTPGYSSAALVMTGLLAFGVGIAVGAANDNSFGWGYSYWNCNWYGGTVHYRGTVYYGNKAWHGGYYGSGATAYGPYGSTTVSRGYNSSTGTYARGGTVSTPYGSRSAGQAYNPSTGTYARGGPFPPPTAVKAPVKLTIRLPALTPVVRRDQGPMEAQRLVRHTTQNGAYAATHQTSNAYGNYGSSVATKNGNTAYTQHQTTSQGSVGSVQTSAGGKGVAGTGAIRQCGRRTNCQWQQICGRPNGKRKQVRSVEWQCLQGHRQWLAADSGPAETTSSLLRGPTRLPPAAMEGRKGVAGHRLLAEVVGNHGRQVLVARRAVGGLRRPRVPARCRCKRNRVSDKE